MLTRTQASRPRPGPRTDILSSRTTKDQWPRPRTTSLKIALAKTDNSSTEKCDIYSQSSRLLFFCEQSTSQARLKSILRVFTPTQGSCRQCLASGCPAATGYWSTPRCASASTPAWWRHTAWPPTTTSGHVTAMCTARPATAVTSSHSVTSRTTSEYRAHGPLPVRQSPFTPCSRLYNRFYNRLYRLNII